MGTAEAATEATTKWATADEVLHATRQLQAADYLRLYKAARLKVPGTTYTDALDLYSEAILTPYLAACGLGGRRWPKDVPFVPFLVKTIQGLASDSRRSAERRQTVRMSECNTDGELRIPESEATAVPSAEHVVGHEQQEEIAQRMVDAIYEHFKDDVQVQAILAGVRDAKGPREIQEMGGMTKTQYESAQRRIRRRLEKLFPERKQS